MAKPHTNVACAANEVSRRGILAALPFLALAPAAAVKAEPTRKELIEQHAQALLDLIREEYSGQVDALGISIRSNPDQPLDVSASANRITISERGYPVANAAGDWSLKVGWIG
ncbi:hypothetical protein BVG79_01094 [Ketogulonicigenium robustum]|uniref:Uncharacterized protein n=1 Tax=Ketogulonicigenium robustum TaxID=92947 RepID=A0A1W6NZB5_9RHOB|nr:hypothetical protein [Ketogulonicigenium robustum]ARO14440.1 hypothetical protein BVG79_01094 [Ketogulonicigenium robustum]